jgi:hypothetical protein
MTVKPREGSKDRLQGGGKLGCLLSVVLSRSSVFES